MELGWKPKGVILDSSAPWYICSIKEAFASYTLVEFDYDLFMGITLTAKILETEMSLLKMTIDKVVSMNKFLHIPTIRKNLVYYLLQMDLYLSW